MTKKVDEPSRKIDRRKLPEPIDLREELRIATDEIATQHIEWALNATGGHLAEAARLLGFTHYQSLIYWLNKLGISVERKVVVVVKARQSSGGDH